MKVQLSKLTGKVPPKKLLNSPSEDFAIPDNRVGIEIEWEGVNRPIELTRSVVETLGRHYWDVKTDGSLRNNGVELYLVEPIFGRDLAKAIESVDVIAQEIKPSISSRCSVHVHVDVRDLDLQELFNFLFLYLVFERTLVKYHGKGREKNIFCLPYYIAPGNLPQLGHIGGVDLEGEGLYIAQDILQRNCYKYSAFNMRALFDFGSIEFRHMGGTTSSKEIREWVNVILSLKREAQLITSHPWRFLDWYKTTNLMEVARRIFRTEQFAEPDSVMMKDFSMGTTLIRQCLIKPKLPARRGRISMDNMSQPAKAFLKAKGVY